LVWVPILGVFWDGWLRGKKVVREEKSAGWGMGEGADRQVGSERLIQRPDIRTLALSVTTHKTATIGRSPEPDDLVHILRCRGCRG